MFPWVEHEKSFITSRPGYLKKILVIDGTVKLNQYCHAKENLLFLFANSQSVKYFGPVSGQTFCTA